jgi:tetraacyldisaccharide 4'-kinase
VLQQRLTERWYAAGARASLLQPLGWLYGALIGLRRRGYASGWLASEHIGRPVIVVGNLTVGGTGKTPLTLWLAQQLRARGRSVGILSRGYGRADGAARTVGSDSSWREVGDEPLLLARRSGCATVVARDRVAGARMLASGGAQLILCDDGLQHLRLARDCAIAVIDGARGFGNGRLLPAGPLREPAAALVRADLVVLNGAPEHPSLAQLPLGGVLRMDLIAGDALRVDGAEGSRALSAFRDRPVHAVAGIGNPARFFRELRAQGLEVIEHAFPDHHAFAGADLAFGDALPVLMTEKDAVKCAAFADARLWYVPVAARFSESDARQLMARVLAKTGDLSVAGS